MRGSVPFGCILNISMPLGGKFDIRIPLVIFQFQSVAFRIRPTGKKPRTTVLKAFFVAHLFVGGWGKSKIEVLCFENRDMIFHNRQRLARTKNL
jgi:hypothetical protein